ncbi:MAG: VWA domain-containing protein, partial [Spirochaetales bacterium]|nr:VWA domain-containing protein [Spirochaetales bacterium]
MKRALLLALAFCLPLSAWSGGAQEEAAQARSEYLAERGMIIPVHEVRIDEFIGAEDYAYPDPEGEFGVYLYTGHRQVSAKGQSEVLVVGVQGRRYRFEDLPTMNLVAVVDTSGSMGEPDKLDWVKESLLVLLDTLRDKDYLSLVLFGGEPQVLLPSARLGEGTLRARLRDEVRGLTAVGDSDIVDALAAGFREAAVHFQPGGSNRVLLLTDGWGRTRGITKLIKANRKRGIEVSVIGYGENFDTNFAREIFEVSGGGSRFVSDRERMEEIFGSGLARTAVPLARNIRIEVIVEGAQAAGAWGLEPSVTSFWDEEERRYGSRMSFTVPVIHSGDYETAVAMLQLPPAEVIGPRRLLTVHTLYTDLGGEERELEAQELVVEVVPAELPVAGFSDARVLKAGTMLRYAQELRRISGMYHGEPYYGAAYYGGAYDEDTQVYRAFFHSYRMKKELKNAATRLGDDSFADQIGVLESYMRITGREIGFKETIVEQIIADNELRPPVPERPLEEHLEYLFRELALDLEKKP